MFHPKAIFRITGILLFIEALFLLGSVPVAIYYSEPVEALLWSVAAMVGTGTLLTYLCRKAGRDVSRKDGYIVVTLIWIVFSLFGSLPYMLSGSITDFTDAFFETMSGFSTTGATILTDIESLPRSILFWRMTTHWVGGLGMCSSRWPCSLYSALATYIGLLPSPSVPCVRSCTPEYR